MDTVYREASATHSDNLTRAGDDTKPPPISPLSAPSTVCTVAVLLVGFHNFDIDFA